MLEPLKNEKNSFYIRYKIVFFYSIISFFIVLFTFWHLDTPEKDLPKISEKLEGRKNTISPLQNSFDIDIGYAQSMLLHHHQAILMAGLIKATPHSDVQVLAKSIIDNQILEMEDIDIWLEGKNASTLPVDGDLMGWMKRQSKNLNVDEALYLARCESDPRGMAGMASLSAIRRLQNSETPLPLREKLFLELMIEHHEAAISMSTLPARLTNSSFIFNIAKGVLTKQNQEIQLMYELLNKNYIHLQ